jgi:hypothetical protein
MPRTFFIVTAIMLAFVLAACDDDDESTPTATSPAATSTASTPAAGTATPAPSPGGQAPAIVIDEPELGAVLQVPFAISGTADVFEAALTVQVVSADGQLICQHHIMATSGSGTRGDWSTMMAFPPPSPPAGQSAVPMVVRALNYSARDGSEENVVTVDVNVSGQRPHNVIQTPLCGEQVSAATPLNVTGVTDAFEGSLQLELKDAFGMVVRTQTVQAQGGTGNAPWSTTLSLTGVNPGFYTLIAFDLSAENGARQNEFPVQIEVVP